MAHGLAVTALRTAPSLRTTGQPISRHPYQAQGIDRDANRGDGWSEATWDCGELPVGSPQLFWMLVPLIVRDLAHAAGWTVLAAARHKPHAVPYPASRARQELATGDGDSATAPAGLAGGQARHRACMTAANDDHSRAPLARCRIASAIASAKAEAASVVAWLRL